MSKAMLTVRSEKTLEVVRQQKPNVAARAERVIAALGKPHLVDYYGSDVVLCYERYGVDHLDILLNNNLNRLTYHKSGDTTKVSYRSPPEALDDLDELILRAATLLAYAPEEPAP